MPPPPGLGSRRSRARLMSGEDRQTDRHVGKTMADPYAGSALERSELLALNHCWRVAKPFKML